MGVREICQIAYQLLLSLEERRTLFSQGGMEVGDFHRIGESDHVVVSLFVTTPVIRMLP